jgi:hypothetical protein
MVCYGTPTLRKKFLTKQNYSYREKPKMTNENQDARISHLEYRIKQLMSLVDPEREPFTYHAMEADLTQEQVNKILDLMDETRERIKSGSAPSHHEFEGSIYDIVPSHDGDYHFAEGIVRTLDKTGRYEDVFKHYKEHGMNL